MGNPYESPSTLCASSRIERNTAGRIGFLFSLAGISGVAMAGFVPPYLFAFVFWFASLCIPGVVIGVVACFRSPRRSASWAVVIGLLGAAYLQTLYLAAYLDPSYVIPAP
ncbi:hypothetical protein [Allorhodopirellula heiligendammensis]|uniref:DUF4190 domain-containing protein n=1 Tax=Allorhodopirellula heiligendammensis TaxID=2714739 RepID=A0A5C6C7D3_9BACT|nr:hypothetical protein [Allorhodopirellula heiligendammensis]TWU19224.1 hypothetical protein Poly21_13950 [Allorhodopirellula heiligendammensis]